MFALGQTRRRQPRVSSIRFPNALKADSKLAIGICHHGPGADIGSDGMQARIPRVRGEQDVLPSRR